MRVRLGPRPAKPPELGPTQVRVMLSCPLLFQTRCGNILGIPWLNGGARTAGVTRILPATGFECLGGALKHFLRSSSGWCSIEIKALIQIRLLSTRRCGTGVAARLPDRQ